MCCEYRCRKFFHNRPKSQIYADTDSHTAFFIIEQYILLYNIPSIINMSVEPQALRSTTTARAGGVKEATSVTWLCSKYDGEEPHRFPVLTEAIGNKILRIMITQFEDSDNAIKTIGHAPEIKIGDATEQFRITLPAPSTVLQPLGVYMGLLYRPPSSMPLITNPTTMKKPMRTARLGETGHNEAQIEFLRQIKTEAAVYWLYALAYFLEDPLLVMICGDAMALWFWRQDHEEEDEYESDDEHQYLINSLL